MGKTEMLKKVPDPFFTDSVKKQGVYNTGSDILEGILKTALGGTTRLLISTRRGDWRGMYEGGKDLLQTALLLAGSRHIIKKFGKPTFKAPKTGASSRLVPGGGLAAHENAGGHLIARHIGQTDAQLAARLANQSRIPAASTFTNRAIAEAAVSDVISANQASVNSWLAGSQGRLVLTETLGNPVGRVLQRGATSPSLDSHGTLRR